VWGMVIGKIKTGQMKIQQMAFMIVAVFFFFMLVGLFFINWQFKDVRGSFEELQKEQAISALSVIADMPELNCEDRVDLCLDEDKLKVMSGNFSNAYLDLWPVASVKVYKVYPAFSEQVECPALNCNYYDIFDNGQTNLKEYSTYVSICNRVKETGYVYDKCGVGKLVAGVKINEE
jgi:hypothetical protein